MGRPGAHARRTQQRPCQRLRWACGSAARKRYTLEDAAAARHLENMLRADNTLSSWGHKPARGACPGCEPECRAAPGGAGAAESSEPGMHGP
jgi:hypothetical protein